MVDRESKDIESRRASQVQAMDRDDFNREISGVDVGRIKRFGVANNKSAQDKHKQESNRSSLKAMLMNTAYHEAYMVVMNALVETEEIVYEELMSVSEALREAEQALNQSLEKASTLPNGERVFRGKDESFLERENDDRA
ncbi:MAG: hypothetical protein HQL69_09870 [Magnetococcales bacterium]|nr:hypothetical protein [Magnetococcales bacterium]